MGDPLGVAVDAYDLATVVDAGELGFQGRSSPGTSMVVRTPSSSRNPWWNPPAVGPSVST